jgi:hypothetical protein
VVLTFVEKDEIMARLQFVAGLFIAMALSSCSKKADQEDVPAAAARPAAGMIVSEAAAAPLPSDDEVRAVAIAFMNEINDDRVPYLKAALPSLGSCRRIFDEPKYGPECYNALHDADNFEQRPAQTGETLKFFKNEISLIDLQSCTSTLDDAGFQGSTADDCRSEIQQFRDRQSEIAEMDYKSIDSVFNVVSIGNYEGTIISYVDIRKKGDDDWVHGKLWIKRVNNAWVADGGSDAFGQ